MKLRRKYLLATFFFSSGFLGLFLAPGGYLDVHDCLAGLAELVAELFFFVEEGAFVGEGAFVKDEAFIGAGAFDEDEAFVAAGAFFEDTAFVGEVFFEGLGLIARTSNLLPMPPIRFIIGGANPTSI